MPYMHTRVRTEFFYLVLRDTRTPRWTSGIPRMPLALVREFESRRREISKSFAGKKKKTGSTAESG